MGYHAYRNIGFVFTETEAGCSKWRKKFCGFDPSRARRLLDVAVEEPYLSISYFGRPYRLQMETGVLEKKTADGWSEELFMNEALVLYHILGDLTESPTFYGEWVPEAELDPVRVRSGNRTDPLLAGFASDFSGRMEQLREACEALGGIPADAAAEQQTRGDLVYTFYPFPQTPVRLVFWEADEEFPAQVQALVDRGIVEYMHFEAAGCMIADLFELLDEKAGNKER